MITQANASKTMQAQQREIVSIAVDRIVAGNNDRHTFDREKLEELAASIQAHGLAQPITVRPIVTGGLPHIDEGRYEIIAGERRFRATRDVLKAGHIDCIIRDLPDEAASAVMLVENTSRVDLDPIDEANAYQERVNRFGWSCEYIADIAGVSADLVKRRISLLQLHPDIQALVAKRQMPVGHAEALVGLDSQRQMIAFRLYRDSKGMTLSTLHRIVSDLLAEQSQDSLFNLETFWQETISTINTLPLRGKSAIVPVPTRKDIPQPEMRPTDNTSQVIMRYINTLLETGHANEAATIGTLYEALIHSNSMALPTTVACPVR